MFGPPRFRRGRRNAAALVIGLACVALPAAAQASPVLLGTTSSFVVLAGSTATNTGPSVLNGDLGVSPGTALVGFGLPAVVNGATHATDARRRDRPSSTSRRRTTSRPASRSRPRTTSRAPTSATAR